MMMFSRSLRMAAAAVIVATLGVLPAQAQETTLRAISGFDLTSQFGVPFASFVEEFNTRGKGLVQIQILGGPDAMPPTENASAVRNGVVDIAWTAPNWYENLFPEATAIMIGNQSPTELRASGGWALLNDIHLKRVNSHLLTTFGYGLQYHQYLVKPVEELTLETFAGLRVRPTPGMQSYFSALGMNNVSIVPGEIYTALERNLLDGYNWPSWGVGDMGWDRHTAVRTEPGYANVQVNMLLGSNSWNNLRDDQQAFVQEMALWFEDYANTMIAERTAEEFAKQDEAGIKAVSLNEADAAKYLELFQETQWQTFREKAPEHVDDIRALFVK